MNLKKNNIHVHFGFKNILIIRTALKYVLHIYRYFCTLGLPNCKFNYLFKSRIHLVIHIIIHVECLTNTLSRTLTVNHCWDSARPNPLPLRPKVRRAPGHSSSHLTYPLCKIALALKLIILTCILEPRHWRPTQCFIKI